MFHAKPFPTSSSPRVQTLTSLLLILFCFFKTERYSFSAPTVTAPSRVVQEQVEPNLPTYPFPRLTENQSADIPVHSEFQPPGFRSFGHLFALLQREYTRSVHLQIYHSRFVPPGTTTHAFSCFRHRQPSKTSDDDNSLSIT
jgi:hypothetical protein